MCLLNQAALWPKGFDDVQIGVFGAPIMMLGDQVWWGNDRLMFIEEYLQQKTT